MGVGVVLDARAVADVHRPEVPGDRLEERVDARDERLVVGAIQVRPPESAVLSLTY